MKKLLTGLILGSIIMINAQAQEIYATFNVEAQKSANLAFSASGIVDKVMVDVGDEVKKQQILVKLQNDDLKALLAVTKTKLKYAKRDYRRRLKIKNIIDAAALDKFASISDITTAQLKYQQAQLDKTTLKAPFDGVITQKLVEDGDVVSGAMIRTILQIQSLHERKLVLEYDQKYWDDVKAGDTFKYKLDGSDKVYEGRITKIYPAIDTQRRKIKAEVKAKDLKVGLFGDGTIITDTKK